MPNVLLTKVRDQACVSPQYNILNATCFGSVGLFMAGGPGWAIWARHWRPSYYKVGANRIHYGFKTVNCPVVTACTLYFEEQRKLSMNDMW